MGRKPKEGNRETLWVRVILTGLLKERFLYLRDKYGAATNKSLVEMLITEKHTELTKEVRVTLEGLLTERFLYLKEKYGAKTNKSLVEMLITEKHAELTKGEG